MLKIRFSNQFKRDFKKVKSQGFSSKESEELKGLIQQLEYFDHPLKGKGFAGTREFHFRPDLLVVYKVRLA